MCCAVHSREIIGLKRVVYIITGWLRLVNWSLRICLHICALERCTQISKIELQLAKPSVAVELAIDKSPFGSQRSTNQDV